MEQKFNRKVFIFAADFLEFFYFIPKNLGQIISGQVYSYNTFQ